MFEANRSPIIKIVAHYKDGTTKEYNIAEKDGYVLLHATQTENGVFINSTGAGTSIQIKTAMTTVLQSIISSLVDSLVKQAGEEQQRKDLEQRKN